MKCPFKTIRNLIYDENSFNSSYGKLIKEETKFAECDENQCPFYGHVNKKILSDASGYKRNVLVSCCKRIETEVLI